MKARTFLRLPWVVATAVLAVSVNAAGPRMQSQAATRTTIASDGWRLIGDYQEPGQGPGQGAAVLLLHGALRDRRAYAPLARELSRRGLASLRLDLRGEGESTNLGRFEPGQASSLLDGTERDVVAAIAWLRRQPGVDPSRVGVLGASYTGQAMALAGRSGALAAAYVALSPGSFSDESAREIDPSGRPWWFLASRDERFASRVVARIPAMSRTARVTFVEGTSHASDILSPHTMLNAEIADWFAAVLAGMRQPALWGGLTPGAHRVGYTREVIDATALDLWYPAAAAERRPMTLGEYVQLSDDLRDRVVDPGNPSEALRRTFAIAVTGARDGLSPEVVDRALASALMAVRDAPAAPGRFPLILWTPRYATTSAQVVLSEYLASCGFVVAFARPAGSVARLPFELAEASLRRRELQARVDDMRRATAILDRRPGIEGEKIGVLAWSYTGEMATTYQRSEPRVSLVVGLSTNLVSDWVFEAGALTSLDPSRMPAAYAVLTQPGPPAPAILGRLETSYFLEFPHLAHGSFNALEGYIPSLLGIDNVQPWSRSGPETIRGYEAAAAVVVRLMRHHVDLGLTDPISRLALASGIADGVVRVGLVGQ